MAPRAQAVCGVVGATRDARRLRGSTARGRWRDGEVLRSARTALRFLATPHLPHGWDAGLFFDETRARRSSARTCSSSRAIPQPLTRTDSDPRRARRSSARQTPDRSRTTFRTRITPMATLRRARGARADDARDRCTARRTAATARRRSADFADVLRELIGPARAEPPVPRPR